MNTKENIESFINNIELAANSIKNFSNEIDNKENTIKREIYKLNEKINGFVIEGKNENFKELIRELLKESEKKLDKWSKDIENQIEGQEFVNKFEKSVMLVVFGNVNAGKSTLGNFIAGNCEELRSYYNVDIPQYYVYDFSDKNNRGEVRLDNSKFKENEIEETSTIQYYTLNNGLTWVDTPGIHSINGNNEDLAKKYVDFADLVIFVISSSSPGKADEIEELEKLIKKKKPLLVVINKSDSVEEDEVDGEIVKITVPKDLENRKSQESYVNKIIVDKKLDKLLKSFKCISISTKVAKEALKNNDENLFNNSGMTLFYKELGRVLSENALSLKKERPIQQVNAAIDEIVNKKDNGDSIEGLIESYEILKDNLNSSKNQLFELRETISEKVKVVSTQMIDTKLIELGISFEKGDNVNNEKIENCVNNIIEKCIKDIFNKEITRILKDFSMEQQQCFNMSINTSFENKYEEFVYEQYELKTVERDPKGLIEKIGKKIFKITYTEEKVKSRKETQKIKIGSNYDEVSKAIIKEVTDKVDEYVESTIKIISEEYLDINISYINFVINELSLFKEKIQKLKF